MTAHRRDETIRGGMPIVRDTPGKSRHLAASALASFAILTLAALGLSGCGRGDKNADARKPPPEVEVVTIQNEVVTLTTELPGRTSPFAISDVRPQIAGIIQARLFQEGATVKAGQPLYQIDPAPYQASFDQAKAQLAYAQANVRTTRLKAERYADLVKINGVAKQDSDDAAAAYGQAAALVAEDAASLESARINLGYTRITSPITGRIGTSSFTQGALVTTGQTSALTTVQTLDPIYVDIVESTSDLLKLRRALAKGALTDGGPAALAIKLTLDDGSAYAPGGELKLTDVTVDQTTGSVTLRAVFPNPDAILLPGMYVRAVVPQGREPAAVLAPQRGVTRDPSGKATVMIVDAEGKAQSRAIETGQMVGNRWLVTKGLAAGDKVIVDGLQNVKQGQPVRIATPAPAEATSPQGSTPQEP
jgi:membrane fusion protein (multidrug efflux system)